MAVDWQNFMNSFPDTDFNNPSDPMFDKLLGYAAVLGEDMPDEDEAEYLSKLFDPTEISINVFVGFFHMHLSDKNAPPEVKRLIIPAVATFYFVGFCIRLRLRGLCYDGCYLLAFFMMHRLMDALDNNTLDLANERRRDIDVIIDENIAHLINLKSKRYSGEPRAN